MEQAVRIDKWLWAVRLYKTRVLAAEACRMGKVTRNGIPVKASSEVRVGDTYTIHINPIRKTIQVKTLVKNRLPAKEVEGYLLDLTSEEEYERAKSISAYSFEMRDRGVGRPTKKERRHLSDFKRE